MMSNQFAFRAAPILEYPRVAELLSPRTLSVILKSDWVGTFTYSKEDPEVYVCEIFDSPDEAALASLLSALHDEGKCLIMLWTSDFPFKYREFENLILFEATGWGTKCCGYFFDLNWYGPSMIADWKPSAERTYLASFLGSRSTHKSREFLFSAALSKCDGVFVRDISWWTIPHNADGHTLRTDLRKTYIEVLKSSKFALCPRGNGPSSIRRWEAMYCGAIPVLIDDTKMPWAVDVPSLHFSTNDFCNIEDDGQRLSMLLEQSANSAAQLQADLQHCIMTQFDNPALSKNHTSICHIIRNSNEIWQLIQTKSGNLGGTQEDSCP